MAKKQRKKHHKHNPYIYIQNEIEVSQPNKHHDVMTSNIWDKCQTCKKVICASTLKPSLECFYFISKAWQFVIHDLSLHGKKKRFVCEKQHRFGTTHGWVNNDRIVQFSEIFPIGHNNLSFASSKHFTRNCPVPIPTVKLCSQHWAIGVSSTHRQRLAAISTPRELFRYSKRCSALIKLLQSLHGRRRINILLIRRLCASIRLQEISQRLAARRLCILAQDQCRGN